MFIYFISSIWICCSEFNIASLFRKIYLTIFTIFCILLVSFPISYDSLLGVHYDLKNYIENHIEEFSSSKIFFYPNYVYAKGIVPYIEQYNIPMYDSFGNSLFELDSFLVQWSGNDIDFNRISSRINDNDKAFIITVVGMSDVLLEKRDIAKSSGLEILPYKCILPCYIYSIKKIK